MGLGFRLNLKLALPLHSNSISNSPSRLSSVRGREAAAAINQTSLSFLSVISEEECDFACKDPFKNCAYSSAPQLVQNDHSQAQPFKLDVGKSSYGVGGIHIIDGDSEVYVKEGVFVLNSSSKERSPRYNLLLENLNTLEESFANSDVLKLERDILKQLGRLGALELFNVCLTRTLEIVSDVDSGNSGGCKLKGRPNNNVDAVVIRTEKKEERKAKREIASAKNEHKLALCSKAIQRTSGKPGLSSGKKVSNSKSRRLVIARNEAEIAKGVKVLVDLEKIRTILEEETGGVVSLSCWAQAAGLEVKVLQQQLSFGWYCKDELIKSTRSLVLYFARNYRGMGIAWDDLLQAGNMGVLQGAERFDHTRGYRFSTYVQYWIRKSMSGIVSRLARGVQIPCTLSRAINKIQKARKTLIASQGKYPDDNEIAKFTGLSLAKVESASRCLRVVGSIDQKMGDSLNAKYLEFHPDMVIPSPEEVVMRQHMIQDIHNLLRSMEYRERQVLILRFGLQDYQPKSLEEIGRRFNVSKEWVRRLEKRVLTRLRNEETCRNLRPYINL